MSDRIEQQPHTVNKQHPVVCLYENEAQFASAADFLREKALNAKSGDAMQVMSLSASIDHHQYFGYLNKIADNLEQRKEANVVRDEKGDVKELVFDANSKQPVDVKITEKGISVDGRSPEQISADAIDYAKKSMAETLKIDKELSVDAKKSVAALENALIDGDRNSFVDAVKGLNNNDQTAEKVTRRLHRDLGLDVNFERKEGGNGGGTLSISDTAGLPVVLFKASTNGETSGSSQEYAVPPESIDAGEAFKSVSQSATQVELGALTLRRAMMNSYHRLDQRQKVSPEELVDTVDAWEQNGAR